MAEVKWTPEKKKEAIEQILRRMCDGESVRSILDEANRNFLPAYKTFIEWIDADEALRKQYARAMELRADKIFDEILEIADESNSDVTIDEEGKIRVDGETVSRSRLRVDARKWALSKMQPKKYGDKLDIDHTSAGEKIEPTRIIFGNGDKTK